MSNKVKITRRGFFKVTGTSIGALFLRSSPAEGAGRSAPVRDSRLRYDVDRFREVAPEFITHKEAGSIEPGLDRMRSISVSEKGDIVTVSGETMYIFYAPDFKDAKSFPLPRVSSAVSWADREKILVAFDGYADIYNTGGEKLGRVLAHETGSLITSVSVKNGLISAADAGRKRLLISDFKGRRLAAVEKGFQIPGKCFATVIGPEGTVWVTNPGKHSLEEYSLKGEKLSRWGKFSMDIDGFAGCCNPVDFAIDRKGNFITSEKGIPRIKQHNRRGELTGVIAPPAKFRRNDQELFIDADASGKIYVISNPEKRIRVFEPSAE